MVPTLRDIFFSSMQSQLVRRREVTRLQLLILLLLVGCGGATRGPATQTAPATAPTAALPNESSNDVAHCTFSVGGLPPVSWTADAPPVGIGSELSVFSFTPTDNSHLLRAWAMYSPRLRTEDATQYRDRLIQRRLLIDVSGALHQHTTVSSPTSVLNDVEFANDWNEATEFGIYRYEVVGSYLVTLGAFGTAETEALRRNYIQSLRCASAPDLGSFDVVTTPDGYRLVIPGTATQTSVPREARTVSESPVRPFATLGPTALAYASVRGAVHYSLLIHSVDAIQPHHAEAAMVRLAHEEYGENALVQRACNRGHSVWLPNLEVRVPEATQTIRLIEFLLVGSSVVELVTEYPAELEFGFEDTAVWSYFVFQPGFEGSQPEEVRARRTARPHHMASEVLNQDLEAMRADLRACTRRVASNTYYAILVDDDGNLTQVRQGDDAARSPTIDECVAQTLARHTFDGDGVGFFACDALACRAVPQPAMLELDALERCPPVAIP